MSTDARMLAFFALKACPVTGCLTLGEHEAYLNNETGEVSHDHAGWSFYATKRTLRALPQLNGVLAEVRKERVRQHAKWGQQDHPDGTGPDNHWPGIFKLPMCEVATMARDQVDHDAHRGASTYFGILTEEYAEAMEQTDPARLRAELVQVAAVAVQWIEAIDRRRS